MDECFRQGCIRPARWRGVWIRQTIPGTHGHTEKYPICALHAEPTAHDAPLRLEELPSRVEEAKQWRAAVRKQNRTRNVAMPGVDWPKRVRKPKRDHA